MKKLIAAALVALAATPALAADPAVGMWQTQVDDGSYAYVKMYDCGAFVCGTIARTFDSNGEYQSENIGKPIVINMAPQGSGKYKGKVWRPSNDKVYIGKMTLNGNSLSLAGCILGGLACKAQTWTRVQ